MASFHENKLMGRKIKMHDGRKGHLGYSIMKLRGGWTYFVHMEVGGCEMIKRKDFEYVKK